MRRLFALMAVVLICGSLPVSAVSLPVEQAEQGVSVAAQPKDRITRFLLLGCDQSTRLTDSIMLVTVNESTKRATILQIPRDTYAEFTDKDYKKLNGAMAELGHKEFKRFLSDTIGVPLDFSLF